ncbi:MAG: hypothetical protein JWO05_849 [Gemmatimonadetes bacterium]|nr:hypothetical protein [Gemmatimonadota bacterium]
MLTDRLLLVVLAASCTGCAAATASPSTTPDRVIVSDNGSPIRQAATEMARAQINAPLSRVWPALVASYAALGIDPTVSDAAAGTYGNQGFRMPSRLRDRPVQDYFDCGTSLGNLGSSGHVVARVESQLTAVSDSATTVVTVVRGRYRSDAGTSNSLVECASRGVLEEYLRVDITRRLAQAR